MVFFGMYGKLYPLVVCDLGIIPSGGHTWMRTPSDWDHIYAFGSGTIPTASYSAPFAAWRPESMFLLRQTGMPSTYGKIPGIGHVDSSPLLQTFWIRAAVTLRSSHLCLDMNIVVTLFFRLAHRSAACRLMFQRWRFTGVIICRSSFIWISVKSITRVFKSSRSSSVC